MTVIRCLRSYRRLPIDEKPDFAEGVKIGVYGNPTAFPVPPIVDTDFQALIDEYNAKRGLYVNGGKAQEAAWKYAEANLIAGLDTTADYVDTLVNGNENMVILAGYKPTKTTASVVTKPSIIEGVVLNRGKASGTIVADCKAQKGVNAYICILTQGAPLPDNVVVSGSGQINIQITTTDGTAAVTDGIAAVHMDLNQNRRKEFLNMVPMQTYYCAYIGINAGGVGSISTSASIVCL